MHPVLILLAVSSSSKAFTSPRHPLKSPELSAGVCSIPGIDPNRPQKVNQDASFIFEIPETDITCYGVMDGHGLKGHILTKYLAQQLPKRIEEELRRMRGNNKDNKEIDAGVLAFEEKLETLANFQVPKSPLPIHQAVTRAFHSAHVDAIEDPSIPAGKAAGTTCIVCLRDKEQLHVAHVGDSRAILILDESVIALTTETTAKIMTAEKNRIEQGEGRLDGNGNVFYGPVGIAMTRALGDCVMLRAGVVPTPIVESMRLPILGNKVVIATDGVWDVLSNEDVASIVARDERSLQDVAEDIAHEAKQKWIGDSPFIDEAKADDITCIVFHA